MIRLTEKSSLAVSIVTPTEYFAYSDIAIQKGYHAETYHLIGMPHNVSFHRTYEYTRTV